MRTTLPCLPDLFGLLRHGCRCLLYEHHGVCPHDDERRRLAAGLWLVYFDHRRHGHDVGRRGQAICGSVPCGLRIFASTFGLTASFGLANYDLPTINTAFIATAAITFVFGALGVTFPKFFQRVYGIGFGILLATILVEIVLMFMGVSQSITDLIVIVVFAGFIGYDTYVATTVPPTLPNAVLMASNLFVDIINVFLRILNILGRRD